MSSNEAQNHGGSETITTDEALHRLDSQDFVDFVVDFWDERGWTITEERQLDTRNVNVSLRQRWPRQRTGLLQVRPHARNERLNRSDVRQFVRTAQREDVDVAYLVCATQVAASVREVAEEFGVIVVDPDELARLVDRSAAHDLIAQRIDRQVAPMTEPFEIPWLLGQLNRVGDRIPHSGRLDGWLAKRIPANPTSEDLTRATFTGFRAAYLATVMTFLLLFAVGWESLLGLLLILVIVGVTYGGLLPAMAADIYATRQSETVGWTPTWWHLAAFVVYPLPVFVGGVYWYRRQDRTAVENWIPVSS